MRDALRRLTLPAIALVACVLAAAPAFAQNQNKAGHEDNGIGIGVLGGFTSNSISTDLPGTYDNRTGSMFGLWVGGNKNGLIGFTGEFNYLISKYGQGPNDQTTKVFEIPALFHINIGSRHRNGVGGFILFGPAVDFLLQAKSGGADDKSVFNSEDIGIMAGGGIEAYRIGVQVRGNWGLRNIDNSGDTASIKTRQIQIVGTFRFN